MGIVVGAIIIGGWNYWQSVTQDKANQASALYEELMVSVSNKETESVDKITERITEQYGSTAYATYAALLLAKTKVEQGDVESAKSIFDKQMKVADSAELRNVARIRLIKLMLVSGENEKGLQLIAEVDQSSSQGFSASYDELTGDLYVALGRLGEARTAYQSALRAGSNSPLLQFKLDDITATDIIESDSEIKPEPVQ